MSEVRDWEEELIAVYVPEMEELGLSFREALELAIARDEAAANEAILNKEYEDAG